MTEVSNEMVTSVVLQIIEHERRSNWAVSNLQYDILLGMPWHKEHNPMIDYKTGKVSLDNRNSPILKNHENEGVKVTNIGVKRFQLLLRRCGSKSSHQTYQIIAKSQNMIEMPEKKHSPRLEKLLLCYKDIFRGNLQSEIPPAWGVDYETVIESSEKTPHISLFQLLAAELVATKECIADPLKNGILIPSKSTYGAPPLL